MTSIWVGPVCNSETWNQALRSLSGQTLPSVCVRGDVHSRGLAGPRSTQRGEHSQLPKGGSVQTELESGELQELALLENCHLPFSLE